LAPSTAEWTLRTSQGFDALCAINILPGDPYYTQQYSADTAMFNAPRLYGVSVAYRRRLTGHAFAPSPSK
jgi:hypothetical protein